MGFRTNAEEEGPNFDTAVFDWLQRDGPPPLPLWNGYRDSVKNRWRRYFWPVDLLFGLRERVELPPSPAALATEIASARTLPLPLGEIVESLDPVVRKHPEEVVISDLEDPILRRSVWALVPSARHIMEIGSHYLSGTRGMVNALQAVGFRVRESRTLEIGCGTGYATFAMGTFGVKEAIGIDANLEPHHGTSIIERPRVQEYFRSVDARCSEVSRLEAADVQRLSFSDTSFDLIHSSSALEHVRDVSAAFREMSRVLKPGGFAYHEIDPWFSPQGGHNMCILDFPWGHARLSDREFDRYLGKYRPHERAYALDFFRNGFQKPPLTLRQINRLARDHDFKILSSVPARAKFSWHGAFFASEILRDCRRQNRDVRPLDLFTHGATCILRKK